MPKFVKGMKRPANAGRKKGTKNKITGVKTMLLETAAMLGGSTGMYNWAHRNNENMVTFYRDMLMQLLPKELSDQDKQEIVAKLGKEQIQQMLIQRGLPQIVYDTEVPQLIDVTPGKANGGDPSK